MNLPQPTPTNLLVLVAPTVTALVFTITLLRDINIRSAQFLLDVSKRLSERESLSRILNEVQYDRFEFRSVSKEQGGHLDSQRESDLIEFLDFLNVICGFASSKLVKLNYIEHSTVGYAIYIATKNQAIMEYLRHIDRHDDQMQRQIGGSRRLPLGFGHLRAIAARYHGRGWLGD